MLWYWAHRQLYLTFKLKTGKERYGSYVCASLTFSCWDLNASCSGCLPEFFPGVFKFQCMLLEKKLYLIDFSFKFNSIKFGNLRMNLFIWEKFSLIVIINLGL